MRDGLLFKADFAATAERWDEFWTGRNAAPMVGAVISKPGVTPVAAPSYAAGAEGDFAAVIEQALAWAATHEFMGAAIPFYYLEFAANHFASLLGGDLVFSDNEPGGWSVPCIRNLESAEIRFHRDCKWWKRTVEFARVLRHRCEGKLLIAAPTLVGNLDALAALRGSEELITDLLDRPDAVHRALRQITVAHKEILEAICELLDQPRWGSITRHGMYSSGRLTVPQCDFSCMISPQMFREFALPYLREEVEHLDCAEYHLDGPGAIQHLEAVCSVPGISVIQWQPGAGGAESGDWSDLYRRIDGMGRGLVRGGTPQQVLEAWQTSTSRRQYYGVRVESREEFERIMLDCRSIAREGIRPGASASIQPPGAAIGR